LAKLLLVRELPPETTTVAAAVGHLIPFPGLPYDQPDEAIEPWIFENVRQLTAQAAQVDAESLSRQTNFIRDLQMR
jgi:hypothetical protein